MQNHLKLSIAVLMLGTVACSQANNQRPTNTPLPLPSPTPVFVAGLRSTSTRAPTERPTSSPSPMATSTATATETPAPLAVSAPRSESDVPTILSHAAAPTAIVHALSAASIESNVYWFKSGDEDQLMVQYASPLRYRPGYEELLQRVKEIVAPYFMKIESPFYTLWIAATDITGTSDIVLRLDRYTVERWSRGEIGDADFYNNGFVPAQVIITCEGGECTGIPPTPFPKFPFPFPFPTPTP